MIVRAVQKGGGADVDKMISSLEGWQFVGPKGTQRIRQQDHALIQPMFSVKLVTQANGKQKPVLVKRFSPGNLHAPGDAVPELATDPRGERQPLLATRHLGLDIGGATIVADVSLEVAEGEFLGIIGPNGAGKTSLFNLLSGLYRPTSGSIELDGRDVTDDPPYRRAAAGLGRTFQISSVFPRLTVLENARLAAEARRRRDAADLAARRRRPQGGRAGALGARPRRARRRASRVPAGALAHGDKRKLELAMVLAGDPRVIMLDEPMAGMSIEDVPALVELIKSVQQRGGQDGAHGRAPHLGRHRRRRADRRHAPRPLLAVDTTETHHPQRGGPGRLPRGAAVSTAPLLEVEDLHVYLGQSHVLQGVSFSVPEGGVTALLGRNGVGKTTTLRALHGPRPAARAGDARRRRPRRSCRRTRSSASASATCPRTARSSPA